MFILFKKKNTRIPGRIAKWVRVLAAKSDDPHLISRTHTVEKENQLHRLSSDFHIYVGACALNKYSLKHTHTHSSAIPLQKKDVDVGEWGSGEDL